MPEQSLDFWSLIPQWSALATPETPAGMTAVVVLTLITIFATGSIYAALKYLGAQLRVGRLSSLLKGIDLQDLSAARRDINNRADEARDVGEIWREFDESLVLVERSNRLFNTIDAAHFFNTHSLAGGLTENRLLAAMPGILTAVGVLGTFAGLQMGLSALSSSVTDVPPSGEIEALKFGIFAMIDGAAIAFTTSLWGVMLSVLFNLYEKFLERLIRSRIALLQNDVDYLYPRITAEQSLANIEDSSRVSKEKLSELDEKIGHRLQEAMSQATDSIREGISASLTEILAPAVQKLVEGAHSGSERALDALMSEFMSKMGAAGEEQRQAIAQTTSAMRSASGQINQSVDALINKLDSVLTKNGETVESFKSVAKANASIVSELGRTTERLNNAAEALDQHTSGFSKASRALEESVNAAATLVADASKTLEGVNAAQSSSIERLEKIYGAISDLHQKLETVGGDAGERIGKAQDQLAELMQLVKGQMSNFESNMASFSESQQEALARSTNAMSQASSGVTERVEALLERVNNTLTMGAESVESFKHVANANSTAATQLKVVADSMSSSAEALSQHKEAIASATSELNQTTAQAGERIKDASDALASISGAQNDSIGRINTLVQQVSEVGVQLVAAGERADQGLTRVNEHFDHVAASLKKHIEELETQLAKLLREYADEVQTQTSDRMNDWNKQTQEYISAMSDAVGALSSVVDDIESKTSSEGR